MKFAKKSLGQNFLIDKNIVKKIVNTTNISNKNILEIGPGEGSLTDEILKKKPKSLILIEKDNILFNHLKSKYKNKKNIKLYNNDILKFDLERNMLDQTIIFGNLPYNISSQILAKIIKFKKWPPKYIKLILMFQKEMTERIIGKFGTSKYGRLSILTNYRLNIIDSFKISPNSFFPKPKVDSAILCFKPKSKTFCDLKNIENLEKITAIFFSNRRKMINKSLKKIFNNYEYLNKIKDIKLNIRPAELKLEKYLEITKLYERMNSSTFID